MKDLQKIGLPAGRFGGPLGWGLSIAPEIGYTVAGLTNQFGNNTQSLAESEARLDLQLNDRKLEDELKNCENL